MNEKKIMLAIGERFLALLLAFIMMLTAFPIITPIVTEAAEVDVADTSATVASGSGTWISGKLTYTWSATSNGTTGNGATGTVSVSNGTLTVTATNSKFVDGGCNPDTAAEATTTTVTVTNASSYPLLINTLTTGGSASVAGVSQGQTIASGATFTVSVTAPAESSSTKVSGTVSIAVEEKNNVTITLKSSPYVGYTVNDKNVAQNGSDQSFTANVGTSITLPSVTAPSGYTFKGWRVGSEIITGNTFAANADYDVFPAIVAEGIDTDADNFKVGTIPFTFWEDAVTEALSSGSRIVVNATEVTLPDNVLDNLLPSSGGSYVKPVSGGGVEYILPAGVTLQLPYDTSATLHTTTPAYGYKARVTPTPFRTMTVPNRATITVNGSISVDSYVCAYGQSNQGNGTPSGPHGKIVMKSGSEMTLNSGANLYCWGYINGDGNVYVKSGAKVYELFQFCDWRGGNGTNNIEGNSQRVFPMSQYYIQNVEAPMRIYKGATEYVWSVVNMSSSAYPVTAFEFIGTNGMFKLTGGDSDYITKRYHANIDQLEIAAHGDMSMNKLSVAVSGLPLIGSITMNSNEYVLPLNNMNIVVETGTTSIASSQTYGVAFLPSSKLTVNRGATFSANAPVYFYDSEDWGGYVGASNLKLVVSGYSTANGTTTIRTADNLKDAELDVNGTVNVSNKLYTTPHGANITSSEGTGVINFTTACATNTSTTYQATQSGTDISYVGITVNNAWLHNGDDSYSQTVSTGTSTWKYDKSGEHWYRYLVDFNFNGNTVARDYYCENNDTVTYDASWLTNLGATASNGTATVSGTDVNVTNVTANSTVTLTGTPAEYKPTFVLNEKQYALYQAYTGNTISNTTTINDDTYYIVDQADSALAVGTAYDAPSNASMGVLAENHNTITWNMSGISATSGDPYRGTVPAGETAQGPAYIYGFYSGVVAYNSYTDEYYDTLIGAFEVLPQDANATITLLADCGTYEEESGTVAYTAYPSNNITLDLNGHKAVGRIINSGTFTLELNGGTLDCHSGATAAAATYAGMAATINSGTMTIKDTAGGGKVTTDIISNSSTVASYSSVVYNKTGATLNMTGGKLQYAQASVNNYAAALLNYGTASISDSTLTTSRGYGIYNTSAGTISLLQNSTASVTHASGGYGVYNNGGKITEISGSELSGKNTVALYNYNGGTITTLENTEITITTPTTKNVYAVWNYGGTITTMRGCTITGNSGINNRNQRTSAAITSGYALAYRGTIGTIDNTEVTVGQYALYNGATIGTMIGSTFTAAPASAQVGWPTGTAALNGNVSPTTIVNSNLWWYDSAVWKRTDTNVTNGSTTMLQRRISEYKTDDAYMPTIGTITDCTIKAQNTSTSNSYGYYALQNQGVINTIDGDTEITSEKHPNNAKSVYGYYALYNTGGGKIGTIGSSVKINAYNYAVTNLGARYAKTDVTYSTTYLESGALKSGGLATDYDYTYADVSYIGSSSATVSATSQYAYLNYSKIGSITGTVSGNYNVIVNAGAAGTTTGIEGSTANARAIEHRYFENNDSSTTANEYRRYFEYTRNTTDGCYIGSINATVTATGAGYQAVTNQGYIGTLAGTVTTPTGKATSSSTYYPLIFNGNQRQATLKQDETYYTETNEAGATKYLREYTYEVPTIDTISCTATNPQDYTLQNYGQINNLTGSFSGKTITVANDAAGPFLTRKTITYYSSASRLAASKASSEVSYEYTKQPAEITNITGATITASHSTASNGKIALRNYGKIGTITGSTITSSSTDTIVNGSSTVTEYTSNRLDVLTGCVPNGTSSCALNYDTSQTIDEDEVRAIGTIDTIGAGNYVQGTGNGINNTGRINTIDSGDGETTIIYTSGNATNVYNYDGQYTRRTNTAAELTNTTGSLTNHYTYDYVPAYIGTIKNVYILGKRNAIMNGASTANANYIPTIGEIGEGTEIRNTAASYDVVLNNAGAKIETISGGVFTCYTGSNFALKNSSTYLINITGGDFRGGDATRAKAISEPDNIAKYTYLSGKKLSSGTETATYHTLSNKVLTAKTNDYYYLADLYTVTFDVQGNGTAPDSQTIESGQKATEPTTPTATGYTFEGWYKEAACQNAWDFSTDTVTQDTILYAKWVEDAYVVSFDMQGHGTAPDDVAAYSGDKITQPDDPTATGYTFGGWYKEAACTTPWDFANDTITGNTILYAKWTVNKYTVTWKNGDETLETDENVEYGTTPSFDGETPTKAGDAQYSYTFAGWSTDGETLIYPLTGISGNTTYIAVFTQSVNKYTVTWVNGTTTLETDENVPYGTTPTYDGATPTKAQTSAYTYTFSGWDPAVSAVTGDITYTAQFTQSTRKYKAYYYNRYYTSSGTLPAVDSSAYAASAQSLSYSSSNNRATLTAATTSLVTADLDQKYTYSELVGWYVTTYSSSTKKFTPVYDTAQTAVTSAQITPEFLNQKAEEGKYTALGGKIKVTSARYIFAVYRIASTKSYAITMYDATASNAEITADSAAYSDVAASVQYGERASAPTKVDNAQYSYTYTGWSTASEYEAAADKSTPVHSASEQLNVVYGAQSYYFYYPSTENKYTVTWKNGDETIETDENVTYGTNPNFDGDEPTKTGDAQYSYSFAGWSTDGETVIDPLPTVSGNTTYIAVFTQTTNTYTVKWTVDESASEADVKAAVDAIIANHAQTVYNEVKADISMMGMWNGTEDKIMFIQLTLLDQYGFSYDDAGYVAAQIVSVVEDNADAAADAESKWNGVKDTIVSSLASSSLTTAAEKSELNALSGGVTTVETDNSVPYGTVPTFNGTTPSMEGDAQYSYSFAGWSTDGETVIDPLTGITGDTTYIAVFTQNTNTYTVTWDVDGEKTTAEYEYGATPVYNNGVDPIKEGDDHYSYIFAGWTPEIAPVSGDATYTAVFQEEEIFNKHSLTLDGTIGVNYYLVMPEGYDENNTYIDFSWGNKYISTNTYSENEPYTKLGVEGKADGDYVKFTVYVAAKELNDEITAVLKDKNSGTVLATERYRGTDYAYDMLNRIETSPGSVNVPAGKTIDQLKALVIDTLIYSAKSQVNFAYYRGINDKFSDLATYRFEELGISDQLAAVDTSKLSGNTFKGLPSGMSYYGGSLNLGSETSYMVVFRNNNKLQPNLSAQYADAPKDNLEVTSQYSGIAAGFTVLNIPAARVTDDITLTINDDTTNYTATINSGAYIRTILTGDYSTEIQEAITALYWYNQSAKEFFGKENEG